MSCHICLSCLNAIDANQLVTQNSHEYYHSCCYTNLQETKKNRLNTDIIDITDSLEIDYSDEPVYLNLKTNTNTDNSKSIGTFIDLSTNQKIHNYLNYNEIKNEIINNILTGPDYATDIAGNSVKLDKQYLINYELEKLNLKL